MHNGVSDKRTFHPLGGPDRSKALWTSDPARFPPRRTNRLREAACGIAELMRKLGLDTHFERLMPRPGGNRGFRLSAQPATFMLMMHEDSRHPQAAARQCPGLVAAATGCVAPESTRSAARRGSSAISGTRASATRSVPSSMRAWYGRPGRWTSRSGNPSSSATGRPARRSRRRGYCTRCAGTPEAFTVAV